MKLSKQALIGYPAGIITGVTYGLNPLFAMPLLMAGAAVQSVLFSATPSRWYCWAAGCCCAARISE